MPPYPIVQSASGQPVDALAVRADFRIGYPFDPIPSSIRSNPRLKPVDHQVLAILVSFAIRRRDSCWTTIGTIAARLPALRTRKGGSTVASERTVQRSLERLRAAGVIRHERVSKPDPDEPRNMTGWRFWFNFAVTPESPDRQVTQDSGEVFLEPAKDDRPGVVVHLCQSGTNPGPEARQDLDPIITEAIGREIPDEPTRAILADQVRAWLLAHTVERIILAICEAAERRRRGKVIDLPAYAGKILANWKLTGRATPRLIRAIPAISAEASLASHAAKAGAQRLERARLDRDQVEQEQALRDAWGSLSAARREAIEAEVDREHPRPGRLRPEAWERIRLAHCLTRVQT